MQIELQHIPVRDLVDGYVNQEEEGIVAYSGRLDVRPKYQREFVYNDAQQKAVIDTVLKGFPLNVMYWVKIPGGRFEIMDGQQRTLSICEFVANHFSIKTGDIPRAFQNLPKDQQEKILDYRLMVYFCEGTDSEKLDWFKTVNIAGEELTPQELLNAIYAGPFTSDAKKHFSKSMCTAYKIANKYVKGSPIRQEYLETAIKWINHGKVKEYMAEHQFDENADDLWLYFQHVIEWTKLKFSNYRKEMKGLPWGEYYNEHKDDKLDATKIEAQLKKLFADTGRKGEITNAKGIYKYVLTGDERWLSLRAFDDEDKRVAYERQKGICVKCGKHFAFEEMQGDHITPWSQGGKTIPENCQMLCKDCNRKKSDK